jgi:hypothetical protein
MRYYTIMVIHSHLLIIIWKKFMRMYKPTSYMCSIYSKQK